MRKQEFDRIIKGFTFKERLSGINDYFQAAVLAPLLLIDGAYHLVFEQRMPNIRQGGEICFPGGKIEATDASPLEAALRETHEEIGCAPEKVEVIGRLATQLLSTNVLVHAYLGILTEPLDISAIANDEVASVFTVPLSFFLENEPEMYDCKVLIHPYLTNKETGEKEILLPAKELGLPAYYSEPWGEALHKVHVYRTEFGLVWGLTAKIVYDCVQRIRSMLRQLEDMS